MALGLMFAGFRVAWRPWFCAYFPGVGVQKSVFLRVFSKMFC